MADQKPIKLRATHGGPTKQQIDEYVAAHTRELTGPEQRNLRHVYGKLFRKVVRCEVEAK
jgi:hypothetical protein